MTDFEKHRHDFEVEQATPDRGSMSSTPSAAPQKKRDPNDKIIKTVECVSVMGVSEAVEFHYESGRIEVVITGGQVDLRSGLVYRWCVAERP